MISYTEQQLTEQLIQEHLSTKRKKPKGIKPPDAVGLAYLADMRKMIRSMKKDVDAKLIPILKKTETDYILDSAPTYTEDQWLGQLINAFEFLKMKWVGAGMDQVAAQIASKFVRSADQVNSKRNAADFGVNIFATNAELQEYLQASVYDNARLIKSIPSQYLTNVESIVMSNVRAGGRWEAVAKQLQQEYGVTDRRAKLIARDQTAKINGQLSAKRQVAAGFEYFQWIDSHDNRVRSNHKKHNDKVTEYGRGIYRWDNPPLSEKGTPIICGTEYQCRCVARPVSNEEVKRNQERGDVEWGVKR